MEYVKLERIWLRDHSELGEQWVQQRIADDPSMLGLGELALRDKERRQPRAGRLDLLLQQPESGHRYEVEIQLGKTDESHIIRTIEYWDNEKKRWPQYEHHAVIVAEEITSRFLNVISLFNGHIPLIALQMGAYRFGNQVSLIFTKVLDEVQRGVEDEPADEEPTDRGFWEQQGAKQTVAIADELLANIRTFAPSIDLKYNKHYIGLAVNGQANNFALFRAKKKVLTAGIKLEESAELTQKLQSTDLDLMEYQYGRYRIRLTPGDVVKHRELLTEMLKHAYNRSIGEAD